MRRIKYSIGRLSNDHTNEDKIKICPLGITFVEKADTVLLTVQVAEGGIEKGGHAEENGQIKEGMIICYLDNPEDDGCTPFFEKRNANASDGQELEIVFRWLLPCEELTHVARNKAKRFEKKRKDDAAELAENQRLKVF